MQREILNKLILINKIFEQKTRGKWPTNAYTYINGSNKALKVKLTDKTKPIRRKCDQVV